MRTKKTERKNSDKSLYLESSGPRGHDGADVRSLKPTQVTGGAWKRSRVCQKRIKMASGKYLCRWQCEWSRKQRAS